MGGDLFGGIGFVVSRSDHTAPLRLRYPARRVPSAEGASARSRMRFVDAIPRTREPGADLPDEGLEPLVAAAVRTSASSTSALGRR